MTFRIYLILGYIVSFSLLVLILHWVTYFIRFNKELTPLEFSITLIPVFVKSLQVCQFTAYAFLLYLQFKSLNRGLIHMQESRDHLSTKLELIAIRKEHQLLCNSARLFNKAFSLQILIILAFDFVLFVVNLYICYSKFVDERFKASSSFRETITLSFFSIQILLHMVSIATMCFYTQKQVLST